jgi:hypothetical protein
VSLDGRLPYVDEHRLVVAAPRSQVWTGLRHYVDGFLAGAERSLLARLLGTHPRAGFEVASAVPGSRLDLTGRHRFSCYRLVFELADAAGEQTLLTARTYAAFPGLHGRVYRALVIGTRAHVVATNHILRSVQRATTEHQEPA